MISIVAPFHRAAASIFGVLFCVAVSASGNSAHAQARFKAHYTISMTGVSIGQIIWFIAIGDQRYTTSANGKASGVLSALVKGEGAVDTYGSVVDGRLTPKFFASKIIDDEGNSELRMTFDEGVVKDLVYQTPPSKTDRVAITDADRRGVADPLTAMLIPAGDDPLARANCNHLLPIFDGRRRYDLALSFKRFDQVTIEHGYAGLVLVCGVILKPIAGYRTDSMLVKYVAGRRDMELWFAPITGTSVIAPIRVSMPTLLGTLELKADQFEIIPPSPQAAPLPPPAAQ
jgi:hypothetical protein